MKSRKILRWLASSLLGFAVSWAIVRTLPACALYLGGSNSLDSTFATSGIGLYPFGATDDKAYAIALADDGSFYLAGYSDNGSDDDFAIAKLTSAGALDTSFDTDGLVTVDFSGGEDTAYAIAIQDDDKVVVVGVSGTGASASLAAVRLDTAGALDTSFDTDGLVLLPLGSGFGDFRSVAIDSSDRILIGGNIRSAGRQKGVIVRLTSAGALDTSNFGSSGVAMDIVPSSLNDYGRIVILTTTRVILFGTTKSGSPETGDFYLAAYDEDGVLDTTFASSGFRTFDFGSVVASGSGTRDDFLYHAIQLTNGNFILTGSTEDSFGLRMSTMRMTSAGAVDTTFGSNGGNLLAVQEEDEDFNVDTLDGEAFSVLDGGSGLLLLAGTGTRVTSSDMALGMLYAAGTPYTLQGYNGVDLVSTGETRSSGAAAVVQSNGRWVVAGSSFDGSDWNFAAIRYRP